MLLTQYSPAIYILKEVIILIGLIRESAIIIKKTFFLFRPFFPFLAGRIDSVRGLVVGSVWFVSTKVGGFVAETRLADTGVLVNN